MKKVKIMLSAILVMSVVAGALAFKAKKTQFCVYTLDAVNNTCPLDPNKDPIVPGSSVLATFTVKGGECPPATTTTLCTIPIDTVIE